MTDKTPIQDVHDHLASTTDAMRQYAQSPRLGPERAAELKAQAQGLSIALAYVREVMSKQ